MQKQTGSACFLNTVRLGVTVVGLMIGVGCAINPVTGRPEVVLTTTEGEREIGMEEARKVEEDMGLVEDPGLTAYVEAVGQRLAQHSPRQDVAYHFHVVEMVEPNAFALPGGFVYVTRGLLALVNSEDELAGVIGHEIGHVAARHAVQRLSAAAPFAIVGGITGAVTGLVSKRLSNVVTGITGFAGGLVLAPYSRSQEREADEVGVQLLGAAGWDPAALSRFLHTLEREVELRGGKPQKASFFDTHPATPERVADTAKQARTVARGARQSVAPDRRAFLAKLDGLVIGPDPAAGIVRENRFLQPALDFALEFPSGWKVENTRRLVAGIEPEERAFVVLQVAGEGDDPMAVPLALERKMKEKDPQASLMDRVERVRIGNLRAARMFLQTKTESGPTAVDLTWIAHGGLLYQITAISPAKDYDRYRPLFRRSVETFRPLTPAEHGGIRITRLRLVTAREGETLEQLVGRAGSAWTPQEAGVANAREPGARLAGGDLVKVAMDEPYKP